MLPPRDDGQRCSYCKSPHLLKFGYEWQCESCFNCTSGFHAARNTWLAEFRLKEQSISIIQKILHPKLSRFGHLARVWPGYTEQELSDTFHAIFRLHEQEKFVAMGIPVQEIKAEHKEWSRWTRLVSNQLQKDSNDPEAQAKWLERLDQMQKKSATEAATPVANASPSGDSDESVPPSTTEEVAALKTKIHDNPNGQTSTRAVARYYAVAEKTVVKWTKSGKLHPAAKKGFISNESIIALDRFLARPKKSRPKK